MSQTGAVRPKLGWPTKSLYGLGALGSAVRGGLTGGTILFFYCRIPGGPELEYDLVGYVIAASLLVDALWDPIVGQISDHTRTRLGRRHPFIYAGLVPAAICMALIYMPPLQWTDTQILLYLLATLLGTRLLDSVIEIPASALLPELAADYDERTSLGSWRYVFLSVVGRLLSTYLAFQVFLKGTAANHGFGQMNYAGYEPYAITAGVIAVIAMGVSAFATQRFVPFMHQPRGERPSFREMAREMGIAVANRNFVALAGSGFIFGIAIAITGGLQPIFTTDFWALGSNAITLLAFCAVPGSLVGVVAAPFWAKRWGKKLGCLIVFFGAIFCTTVPIGLRLIGLMPPNGSPWVLVILIVDSAFTGLLATIGFIIVTSMLADVVEEVAIQSGRRSEGVLFSADSLLRKVTTSFASALPAMLISWVHYPKHVEAAKVPWPVLQHLAIIYLPLVTALYLCSTSMLMLYRIDRKRHEENLDKLAVAAALAEGTDTDINPDLAQDVITSTTG